MSFFHKGSCGLGAIINLNKIANHKTLRQALEILVNLEHRGATGQDVLSGDGAGLMLDIPDKFFRSYWKKKNILLPKIKNYAVGMFFFSKNKRKENQKIIEKILIENKIKIIGWREVPTDNSTLSKNDIPIEPHISQIFIENSNSSDDSVKKLYALRKKINIKDDIFDIVSFSNHTIIYKGLFLAKQIAQYYLDFKEKDFQTSFALVHQRYSTNTLPSWKLAHPMKALVHNGEINTIIGNINSCNARENQMISKHYSSLESLFPIIEKDCSDSLGYDNFLEFLICNDIDLPKAIMMMMPQAWENESKIPKQLQAFYRYYTSMLEAWDGPAAIAFADHKFIGAAIDRNGLRPLRYYQTPDSLILASEAGVLPIPEEDIILKGKLGAGEIFAFNRKKKQLFFNDEIKNYYSSQHLYQEWNKKGNFLVQNSKLLPQNLKEEDLILAQKIFSYSEEDFHMILKNMSEEAEELTYAMGSDTPLAIMSKKPQLLYNYFHQKFAQVTNPPIDPIREQCNMSLESYAIHQFNLLEDNPKNAEVLVFSTPFLNGKSMQILKEQKQKKYQNISILYDPNLQSLENALFNVCEQALKAVKKNCDFLIFSDQGATLKKIPIPALLAIAGVHHFLIKKQERRKVGFIIESGEPREPHHFALLLGYGATAIYPYLALDSIKQMAEKKQIKFSAKKAQENYQKALEKSLRKIMSKIGISTLNSYQGAQIFEAVGLNQKFIEQYFYGTNSSIGGIGIELLEKELLLRHKKVFSGQKLFSKGEYNWRQEGEIHLYNPTSIHLLQQAAWHNNYSTYQEFVDNVTKADILKIRDLLEINSNLKSISIDEVETEEIILKRFCTGAMSIGAISKESHEDLAIAMNRIGAKSNTGEGGEDMKRYHLDENGDSKNSKIKQIASGRFGVTSYYLSNAEEIQIKICQGAKPGEGGQIRGIKVDDYIAKLRHTVAGITLVSPPPHHDIYSIEDLAQLIYDLKNSNPNAEVSVKLASSQGVGTVATGVVKGKADRVVIAGFEGGTGASPASSIKHAGIPWEIGLVETQQMLVENKIRDRVVLQIDGQITTGRDVIIGGLLGAEEFGFSTSALVTQGCILMRKCHLNTCPVGIATQNPLLRKKYKGKPEYIINYLTMVAREVREIMAKLGIRKFDDLIGKAQFLKVNSQKHTLKTKELDFSFLLQKPQEKDAILRKVRNQDGKLLSDLNKKLVNLAKPALENKEKVRFKMNLRNTQRSVGTLLGHYVTKKYKEQGLPEDTINIDFQGTAGQSFGAFLPAGISLRIQGDANDYLGKGLSGGKIVLKTLEKFQTPQNILVGNTVLYGATRGKVFLNGKAGERFAVRNSNALAVVEGVGEHACEYMTGGIIIILGKIGRNFGAGMSGGKAYIFDDLENVTENCNLESVEALPMQEDEDFLALLKEHYQETKSKKADFILKNPKKFLKKFCAVYPKLPAELQKQKAS